MAKILIVDDSSFVRAVLRKYLEKQGHQIVGEADDGKDALSLYIEHSPDIVTLDIVMPSNGISALEEIINHDPEANVILISGLAHPSSITKAIKMGAKCFLYKPVCDKILSKVVNDVLSNSQSSKKRNNGNTGNHPDFSDDIAEAKDIFIQAPEKTFLLSMYDNTLTDFCILQNDILVIEKDAEPQDQDLIVGLLDENLTFGLYIEREDGNVLINVGTKKCSITNLDARKIETLGVIRGLVRILKYNKSILA